MEITSYYDLSPLLLWWSLHCCPQEDIHSDNLDQIRRVLLGLLCCRSLFFYSYRQTASLSSSVLLAANKNESGRRVIVVRLSFPPFLCQVIIVLAGPPSFPGCIFNEYLLNTCESRSVSSVGGEEKKTRGTTDRTEEEP